MKKILLCLLLAFSLEAAAQVSGPPPGLVLIQRQVVSNVATVDFTVGLTARFDDYVVFITDLTPATDAAQLFARVSEDGGGTWKAGAADYAWTKSENTDVGTPAGTGATAAAQMILVTGLSSTKAFNGALYCYAPSGSARHKVFNGLSGHEPSGGLIIRTTMYAGAYIGTVNAINGLRFLMSAGNVTQGTFTLYGIRR